MAHRGVRHEPLQIHLNHGHESAVDNANDGQHGDVRREMARGLGKERQAETQHAVGTHLQQDAGQEDGAGSGRLGMGVGQPCVERKERHLDGKRQEESAKEQVFRSKRQHDRAVRKERLDLRNIEGRRAGLFGNPVKPQDSHEHQDRAEHRVQHEFQRGVNAAAVAPDANQEVHRDQHHFPEQKEQEQVERNKDADHSCFEHQQRNKKALRAPVDRFPGGQHRDGREERGEQDQKQADAVDAKVVVNRRLGNPGVKFLPLEAGRFHIESPQEQQGKTEFDGRGSHREAANPDVIVAAEQKKRERARSGQERQNREQVGLLHFSPPSTRAGK